jgi:hypothetical protein
MELGKLLRRSWHRNHSSLVGVVMGFSKKEFAQRLFIAAYADEHNRSTDKIRSAELCIRAAELFERTWLDNHHEEVKVPL